jgi:formate hydrogenlyase subunit 3/multisubunit Na+/H+ antiporter MnhD subunit
LQKGLTLGGQVYLLFLTYQVYRGLGEDAYLFDKLIYHVDALSLFVLVFIQVLSLIILVFSLKGLNQQEERFFFALFAFTIAFCNGAVLAVDMVIFLIFWGLSGVTLYLFGLLPQNESASQTARKTFIIVGGSDVFLILGLLLLYRLAPSGGWSLWGLKVGLEGEVAHVAFFALLIAAFAKAGGFPMHTWVPEFAKEAPVESVALLPAALDKLLGIYLLARMMFDLFKVTVAINVIVITLGAFTVIFAVMMAMIQHNGRRLLGYHAVSQVGYMIMGVGTGNPIALLGGLFHMVNNTIYKSGLFLSLGSVEKKVGTSDLDDIGGLGRQMPLTFIAALTCALAISGIPPLNGFYSKWLVYQGTLELVQAVGRWTQLWLLICLMLAVFGSALTLASFMKFLHTIYLGRPQSKWGEIKEAGFNQVSATLSLAALCLIFGLWAQPLPLSRFILPVLSDFGLSAPNYLGYYSPLPVVYLFGVVLLLGLVIFLLIKNVRYDAIYLGGMEALEKFRIAGTEFYHEIKNMRPFNWVYNQAEQKHFDIYHIGANCSRWFTRALQFLHRGNLSEYNLWIVLGTLILLGVIYWVR